MDYRRGSTPLLCSKLLNTMKPTTYLLSFKKHGNKWKDVTMEFQNDNHLNNYLAKMQEYGWKNTHIEIVKPTTPNK